MPIPFMDRDWREVAWWNHCIGKELLFSFLPRKCYYSKKPIWLTRAYRVTSMWTGPGTPVFDSRWIDKNEYLIKELKGETRG